MFNKIMKGATLGRALGFGRRRRSRGMSLMNLMSTLGIHSRKKRGLLSFW